MSRYIATAIVFAAFAGIFAYTWVTPSYGAQSPIKTVERLAFARESATEKGTKFKLLSVKCAATKRAYIYVCNFGGLYGKQSICAATYVHYHPGHSGRYQVNFWGQDWQCGSTPPMAPPAYPGDGGPKS